MKTLRERFISALERRGCVKMQSRSTKYVVLLNPTTKVKYFIGKSGAVRRGQTVVDSVPVSDAFKKALLKEDGS